MSSEPQARSRFALALGVLSNHLEWQNLKGWSLRPDIYFGVKHSVIWFFGHIYGPGPAPRRGSERQLPFAGRQPVLQNGQNTVLPTHSGLGLCSRKNGHFLSQNRRRPGRPLSGRVGRDAGGRRPATRDPRPRAKSATRDPRHRATRASRPVRHTRSGPDIPGPAPTFVRTGVLKLSFDCSIVNTFSTISSNISIFNIDLRPMFSVKQ